MSQANKIYTLIPKVMKEVGAIGKNGYNPHDKYKFRSIDDVYNTLQAPLANNGVFFLPEILEQKEDHIQSKSGTDMVRTVLKVKYTVYADDGSFVVAIVCGEAVDRCDKSINKALTAAFKYMLIQIFCIAVKDMDDADKDSPQIGNSNHTTNDTSKPEPKSEFERIFEDNTPKCELCGTEMKTSKAGTHWYCPNWKDTSQGEHRTIKK